MYRSHGFGHRNPDSLDNRFDDRSGPQRQACLGDGGEKLMMVDIHLDTPAMLVGVQIAGDCDHRRPVEPGIAHTGRKVRRSGSERCDRETWRARHPSHYIGGKSGRPFMCCQHKWQVVETHRLHQRQDIAARDPETMGRAGLL